MVVSVLKRTNVGIIGCGFIAEKAHIRNTLNLPESKLVGLSDINVDRLEAIRAKFDLGKDYCDTDYSRMLNRKELDAVVISTPAHTHAEIVLASIDAGKHVFVEKPLAASAEEAKTIVEAAERRNVKVMVGFEHRFCPNHRMAKRYLREGRLGTPFYGEVHGEQLEIKPEEGILLDYGVHLIDLLCFYFDNWKVKEVGAMLHSSSEKTKLETEASLVLRFDNGAVGRVGAFWMENFTSWGPVERYVKILGSKGKLVTQLTGPAITLYSEGSFMSRLRGSHTFMPRGVANEYLPLTEVAYREELEHFFRCIANDKNPEVDAKWGLMVQQIVDAAKLSDKEGRFVKVTE